jgi:cholinesterase
MGFLMQYLFSAIGILLLTLGAAAPARATAYDRLYVFGDSYSDIGAGYLDGNGPTAVAYLAQKMGIPFVPSNDPDANAQGIDFAVTGAKSGANPGKLIQGKLLLVGVLNQVYDFAQRVGRNSISFNPATTLFFFEVGLNEHKGPAKPTIDNITREIEILKHLGARHITVALLPVKIPDFTDSGTKLDPALETTVSALRSKLAIDLTLNHFGAYLDDIVDHPAAYGLANTTSPCAGRALFGEDETPCADPATYFYFHESHPSTFVNKIVGDKLYDEIIDGHK